MKHCPTSEMIVDYYTKPLQGKQFYNLRSIIMGHKNMEIKERVGENIISNILKNDTNQNGKDKSLNRETSKIIKNGSIIDCKEQTEQMAREGSNEERMKNAVSIKGKKVTYAEALLNGTKSGEKKDRFKM